MSDLIYLIRKFLWKFKKDDIKDKIKWVDFGSLKIGLTRLRPPKKKDITEKG